MTQRNLDVTLFLSAALSCKLNLNNFKYLFRTITYNKINKNIIKIINITNMISVSIHLFFVFFLSLFFS